MKRFLMLLMVTITCLSFLSPFAEAKRFGGGSSFGKSRPAPTRQAQKSPESTPQPAQSGMSKWMGPLAGLAIGAGLASMFSGGGLASGISSILMVLAIAAFLLFLFSKFRKAQQPAMQYSGMGASYSQAEPVLNGSSNLKNTLNIPADFPVESFLRNAKLSFIRLQAANDRKDINDVREYTTPELFAEITMQMQERDNAVQVTEVLSINAELLEVVNEDIYSIASVRFTAQLRENNKTPENIDEIWVIQKELNDSSSKWLLAGIKQLG